jgi:hypothetical protein
VQHEREISGSRDPRVRRRGTIVSNGHRRGRFEREGSRRSARFNVEIDDQQPELPGNIAGGPGLGRLKPAPTYSSVESRANAVLWSPG